MPQVRGIDQHHRPVGPHQVCEGRVAEERVAVVVHRHFGAAAAVEPAQRVEQAAQQRAFDVAAQEALLEVLEYAVAIRPVVGRGETAARDRADQADGVEQALVAPVDAHLCVAQFEQHAIGQRSCARAATRKSHRQRQFTRVAALLAGKDLERIALAGLNLDDRQVVHDAVAGTARQQRHAGPEQDLREWRRDPESNRAERICNPVHNRFAIAPLSRKLRTEKKGKPELPFS